MVSSIIYGPCSGGLERPTRARWGQGSRTVVAQPETADIEVGQEERSEEFQILLGQLQEMRSQITALRSKIEELDERTKDL